jgi:toxin ParE1/3/4
MRFRFSRRAQADIEEIGDYIARDNPLRAVSFTEELREYCKKLAGFPGMGTSHPELGSGIHMTVFGRYLIFYDAHDDRVEIKRVLHHGRNIRKIMQT